MDTSSIVTGISRHIALNDIEALYFKSLLLPLRVNQGQFVETAGEVTKYFIHVNAGCLMTYFSDPQGTDHVIQFATAGWWTGDLQSFTRQTPSIYSTKALADSEIFLVPHEKMNELLDQYPKFERYFRILYQNSLITHQDRLIQNLSATAEERYHNFLQKYPGMEQYVPLKYIASYLGFTPEFLSKIRRKIMERS
jgi:CRP-like cAMP-binding protein